MRGLRRIAPLLLITLFLSFAAIVFAPISFFGGGSSPIQFVSSGKGPVMFDIDFTTSRMYFSDGYLMLNDFGVFGSIGFSCETPTANMTITKVASNELTYTVDGPTDVTSTTKIYVGLKGRPTEVTGSTSWSYSSSLKVVTVNCLHESPADIGFTWEQDGATTPVWVIQSYRANMDFLWLIVSILIMSLMLSTIRGASIDIAQLMELVFITIGVYIGGYMLIHIVFQI